MAEHWNYRVIQHKALGPFDDDFLGIHEVYYDDQERIRGFTDDPCVTGDDLAELLRVLVLMTAAASLPVLADDVETVGWPDYSQQE